MKKQIKFLTPVNSSVLPFTLSVDHSKTGELLEDETLMSSLDLDNPPHIFADIRYPPRFKPSNKYELFIVGGLKLSEISEL
jgi:hypothetical protein